uniref:Uncharacterized protein n=1 Tax=Moniliophthora roreri TaxID=221103 RepID=A0A0W0FTE7_MONRR
MKEVSGLGGGIDYKFVCHFYALSQDT